MTVSAGRRPLPRHVGRPDAALAQLERVFADARRIKDQGLEAFKADPLLQRAAHGVLTQAGEMAKRLPDQLVEATPQVPWRDIAKLRNKVCHNLERVDPVLVWNTVAGDLLEAERSVARCREVLQLPSAAALGRQLEPGP